MRDGHHLVVPVLCTLRLEGLASVLDLFALGELTKTLAAIFALLALERGARMTSKKLMSNDGSTTLSVHKDVGSMVD